MQIATSKGVIHYEDEGSGPVLTLVHGDPGRPQDFRWLVPHLTPFFRLIRIAMPGLDLTDLSVQPRFDIASRALFIREFLDRLQIDKSILLGHSMGSALVMEHGVQWPKKTTGIILLNPVGVRPHKPFQSLRRSPFIPLLNTPLRPPLLALFHRAFISAGFPKGVSKKALLHIIRCSKAFDFNRHVHNIQSLETSCLRIHAQDDPLINVKLFNELHETLQDGVRHIFEAAGHNPQKTKPEELALLIKQWAQQEGFLNVK